MTTEEANKLIEKKQLKTKGGELVTKVEEVRSVSGESMFEVYVEGIPWCLTTVYASDGVACRGYEDNDDLDYNNI